MSQIESCSKPVEEPSWEGQLNILSLDGGGIKGLFSAAVLAKLEEDHKVSIVDHFDLIVGTSTGGILAIALGLGLSPAELVEFYIEHGPKIFGGAPEGKLRELIHHARRRKYGNEALQNSLQSVFGDRALGQSSKRLVIPAYNMGEDEVRLFKTAHHSRLMRDWKLPAWEIAMATSAAPTYFPAWHGIDDQRLVDGGVWANNPTMVGIIEAKSVLGASLEQIRVMSLGTCDDLVNRPGNLDEGGLLAWKEQAVKVVMRGQS
ncbi:patatin, partial [bacterium]